MNMTIKVLIADDHTVVREGIRMILAAQGETSVVGEAHNGREAVAKAEALLPDIILMDISMSEMSGLDATRILKTTLPSAKVIILSMHNTSDCVVRALQAGARAYISKDSAGIEIHNAIRTVMNGNIFIGSGVELMSDDVVSSGSAAEINRLHSLSRRERETLTLIAEGKSNIMIAELMNVSLKSVETYRHRLMAKLKIKNISTLVRFAFEQGVVSI
jgi:DNA-binding NarL/FixJ family response regulator